MPLLTIESDHAGAQVKINGEDVGITPISILVEPVDITLFRKEYVSGGNIICQWPVIKSLLENQTIGGFWWDLTRDERYSIAEMTIKNTLFYQLYYDREGKSNCEGGEGEVHDAVCVQNGIVRYLKFGTSTIGGDHCYYRRHIDSEEYCYVPDIQYGLPCHIVGCLNPDIPFGHAMAAIQIVEGTDSLNNWIIFQYDSFDIKPGNWQLPTSGGNMSIKFGVLSTVSCGGYSHTTIKKFENVQ